MKSSYSGVILLFLFYLISSFQFQSKAERVKESTIALDSVLDISISMEKGPKGFNRCVEFTVVDFDSIISAQIPVRWNPDIINSAELQSNALPDADFVFDQNLGTLRYLWSDATLENPVSLESGAILFEICFNIS